MYANDHTCTVVLLQDSSLPLFSCVSECLISGIGEPFEVTADSLVKALGSCCYLTRAPSCVSTLNLHYKRYVCQKTDFTHFV